MNPTIKDWMKDNLVILRVKHVIPDAEMVRAYSVDELRHHVIKNMELALLDAVTPYLKKVEKSTELGREIEVSLIVQRRKHELQVDNKADDSSNTDSGSGLLCS